MRNTKSILLLVLLGLTACSNKPFGGFMRGDVPMVVGMFENYYGKHVQVVGYMYKPPRGNVLVLIPSKDHINLQTQPPANILSLLLFSDTAIRNGSVHSEMEGCIGKTTYVSGLVGIFSGLPAIEEIREVAC